MLFYFHIYCSFTDFQRGPPHKPEHQLHSSHDPQFLALRDPLLPDSQKYFSLSVSSPSPPVLIPPHRKLLTALNIMYNLEYFCFIPLQLVIQVMAPGEAPKILGSSFEHSRKISQFLTCGPSWLVFILAVPIAVLELISDTDSKFCFLECLRVELGE